MDLFKRKVKDDLLIEEETKSKFSFLKSKAIWIGGGVVLVIAGVVIVKSVFMKDTLNYYNTMEAIFSNELGSFTYTLDVRTGEKGSLIKENKVIEVSQDELNNMDSAGSEDDTEVDVEDIAKQDGESTTQKNDWQDWDKYADTKTGDWEYPNYKVTVSGVTTSLEPLTTDFTISLATEYWNDVFTEVVCIDGNYYFDIESMYNWFKSSGDEYLVSVGKNLPHGSKWLVVPESEFKIASRYAEEGEKEFSYATSLKQMYQRFLVALNSTNSTIQGYVGDTGVNASADVVNMNLSGADALQVISAFKQISTQGGDFYDSLINRGVAQGLYTNDEYEQAVREKDNVITALSDLATYLNITSLDSQTLALKGTARTFVNGKSNNAIEGSLIANYSTEDTDYIIQFTGLRSGDSKDITLPSGSQTKTIDSVYLNSFYKLFDYLNVTPIKTSVQLEINPDTISEAIIEKFITLVNETGSCDYHVTRNNVFGFIETYANYKETDKTTNNDLVNAKLVTDLAKSLNNIVGGVIIEREAETEVVVEQYPMITWEKDGVVAEITYNEELSDANMVVFHVDAINKSDNEISFNATDFSLRTLLNSKHPANNEVMMRNYDNMFDMSLLTDAVVMPAKSWTEFDLYFTLTDDTGHIDMYFGEDKLGSAIEY